jgi:hypothetical protein
MPRLLVTGAFDMKELNNGRTCIKVGIRDGGKLEELNS